MKQEEFRAKGPFQLHTQCIIATHWPIKPFSHKLQDPLFPEQTVKYNVDFEWGPIKPEENQTVVHLEHWYDYPGSTCREFLHWGVSADGGPVVLRHVLDLLNLLIDIITVSHPGGEENEYPYMRHVGLRDLVDINILAGTGHATFFATGSATNTHRFASAAPAMVTSIDYPLASPDDLPIAKTHLHRAIELLDSGYATEAALVAFAFMDHEVQRSLDLLMMDKGLAQKTCDGLRRSIKDDRLKTFLNTLLKLLTGTSLEEGAPELLKRLEAANTLRNNSMHQAKPIPYEKAQKTIVTVVRILRYLHKTLDQLPTFTEPEPPSVETLPFLFENLIE